MNISNMVNEIILEYQNEPVDILNLGDAQGESRYLLNMAPTYVRTINDLCELYIGANRGDIKVLEIGSYLGVVSIGLSRLGFDVTAADLPIFMSNLNLNAKYNKNHIDSIAIDLKDPLTLKDNSFNCIVLCETLEHLNFNPIPVLTEIRRVLKEDGFLYLSVPNISRLENRIKLLFGKPINNSIDEYFSQLDPTCNFSVGLHWREYTKMELINLLDRIGFKFERHYYFHAWDLEALTLKFYVRSLWSKSNFIYVLKKLLPATKENQTIICKK
jgi:SAM-dependent methyltransferase